MTVRRLRLAALVVAAGLAGSVAAHAQTLGFGQTGDAPIHIEADNGIEWQRDKQLYLARGNARASQGESTVEGDELIAYYRENATGDNEIYRLDAVGHVRVLSRSEVATGDRAIYDVLNGVLVMTGERVRLETAQDTIEARDSLEYYEKRRLAVARGDALAIRADRRLKADILMAHFVDAQAGASRPAAGKGATKSEPAARDAALDRIEAVGNVLISTPTDIVIAERGDYDLKTGLAQLTGGVKITRGETQLNGERAEVNLNTGRSRLLSGGERVKGVFLPKAAPTGDNR
jgi:lipopolysaccharide export system protein LptA